MPYLYHITSIQAAVSIVRQGVIFGKYTDQKNNPEGYPHFFRDQNTRFENFAESREICLCFYTPLPVGQVAGDRIFDQPLGIDCVWDYGGEGNAWQTVVAPGSSPILFLSHRILPGSHQISKIQQGALKRRRYKYISSVWRPADTNIKQYTEALRGLYPYTKERFFDRIFDRFGY